MITPWFVMAISHPSQQQTDTASPAQPSPARGRAEPRRPPADGDPLCTPPCVYDAVNRGRAPPSPSGRGARRGRRAETREIANRGSSAGLVPTLSPFSDSSIAPINQGPLPTTRTPSASRNHHPLGPPSPPQPHRAHAPRCPPTLAPASLGTDRPGRAGGGTTHRRPADPATTRAPSRANGATASRASGLTGTAFVSPRHTSQHRTADAAAWPRATVPDAATTCTAHRPPARAGEGEAVADPDGRQRRGGGSVDAAAARITAGGRRRAAPAGSNNTFHPVGQLPPSHPCVVARACAMPSLDGVKRSSLVYIYTMFFSRDCIH